MLPEGAKPIIAAADEAPASRSGNGASEGRRWGRWIAFLFVFSAVVGFGSLLAYTYLETRDGPVDPNSLPVVRADARPMKIRPETPGGIDVPFQDKEVFERVGQQAAGAPRPGQPAQAQRPAERLMPGPEQPLPRPVATPPPPPVVAVPAAPEVAPPPNAVPVTPPARASVPPGGAAAPTPAPVAPTPQPPPQVAQAPRAAPPPAAPAAQASGIRIQLASVRSEADAQREWDRMRRQQSDVLGALTPMFPSADLGERGVFWRVQAGGFADLSAAQEACAALRGRGLGCNVVR